jgi:hypothetical protein
MLDMGSKIYFFKKSICFITFLLLGSFCRAQSEAEHDTIYQKDWGFKTSLELADTAWLALQQKSTAEFISLIPTLAVIKETFDTLDIKNNKQVVRIKYNYIFYSVSKQLKALNAKVKANKLKLKTCELDKIESKEGKDDKGNPFAYITLFCHKNKREFTIKFVALQLNKNWYVVDELKLEFAEENPYYKKAKEGPVKVKRK